jgi:hypothetical protein
MRRNIGLLCLLLASCGSEPEQSRLAGGEKVRSVLRALPPWRGVLAEFEVGAHRIRDGKAVQLGRGVPGAVSAADIVIVADDHLVGFYQVATGKLLEALAREDGSRWAIALEAFGPESSDRTASCGGDGCVRCLMAELRRTWPYPVNWYRRLVQAACRGSVSVLCVGSNVRAPALAGSEDANRRPVRWTGMPPNAGRVIVESTHQRMLRVIPNWLTRNQQGHLLLLCGAGHVRFLEREFSSRGFDMAIVIPFLASWELSLRSLAGGNSGFWWEVLPGVYRPPFVTDEVILEMSGGASPRPPAQK